MKKMLVLAFCVHVVLALSQRLLAEAAEQIPSTWPAECQQIDIISSVDSCAQKAWFYRAAADQPRPLIVSLHTWSGDFSQEDPLLREVMQRDWNYIHPDFRGKNNNPQACGSSLVVSDLEDAIRYAISHSRVDTANIHVIGVSGGGHAALVAFMRLKYPVRSFNAWCPLSDLDQWYWECRGRNLSYADDICKITGGETHYNRSEALMRSPLHMPFPREFRKNSSLHIYAGIHDGYTGSVPISQSMAFYNRIAGELYPGDKDALIPDSVMISLIIRRINPSPDGNVQIGGRRIHYSRKRKNITLTIFEGGHEMLMAQALSLLPGADQETAGIRRILTIADSNSANPDGWPNQLGKLLPDAEITNQSVSGNTISFDNLGQPELNTLKHIDGYPAKCCGQITDGQNLNCIMDSNVVLPPAWAFGVLYGGYTDQAGTIERINSIQAHGYPIDAYWIDSWFWSYANGGAGPHKYIDFIADDTAFPDRRKMWSFMADKKIKSGFWIWDCIQKDGNEAVFEDFRAKGYFKDIYLNKNPWHNLGTTTALNSEDSNHPGTLCGNIDFNNQAAVNYVKSRLKHFFDEGADFIKLDRTADINVCKAMFEATQELGRESRGRGFIMSHSFGLETEAYKRYPVKWTDDTRADWNVVTPTREFDPWVPEVAFKENIAMYTDSSQPASAIPFLANDLGGFDIGKKMPPDEELFIRWLQFSMFCPITEVFSQPQNPTSNLAWLYSGRADSLFRAYSHLRMELFPYIYSSAHETRLSGRNIMRPVAGEPGEYFFGEDILVAPVYEQGVSTRTVTLPDGNWIDIHTETRIEGNQQYTADAPIGVIPLFVREGAIIPKRAYAPSIESGDNDLLLLEIYPGSNNSFTLIEDDGRSNDYLKGIYAATRIELESSQERLTLTINPVEGNFDGMKQRREWRLAVHTTAKPKSLTLNGEETSLERSSGDAVLKTNSGSQMKTSKTVFELVF